MRIYSELPIPHDINARSFRDVAEMLEPSASPVGVEGVIAGSSRWDGTRMDSIGPGLVVISRAGIGYDDVDIGAATDRSILVCNAPDAPTVSTSEHVFLLMLATARRLPALQEQARSSASEADIIRAVDGLELEGRTLGLLGYGRIGRRVGGIARAYGMKVVATDPHIADEAVALVKFGELLARSDILSLHAPLTSETRHIVDAAALSSMKNGSILINTARGGLVDNEALLRALQSGHLRSAGLDVTDPKPLPVEHPLLRHPNVIVTPHVAASTEEGKRRLFLAALEHAIRAITGGVVTTALNVVNHS